MDLTKISAYTFAPVEQPNHWHRFVLVPEQSVDFEVEHPDNVVELVPRIWRHGLESFKEAA